MAIHVIFIEPAMFFPSFACCQVNLREAHDKATQQQAGVASDAPEVEAPIDDLING